MTCKHCGLSEEEHHEYEKQMPDGCQCDPKDWGEVNPICIAHVGDHDSYCERCEHDKACHRSKP